MLSIGTATMIEDTTTMTAPTLDRREWQVVTLALREELTGIQYGRVPDRHGWLHRLR